MKNKLFKITCVVIIICIIASIFVPFSVKSSQVTLRKMENIGRGFGSHTLWKSTVDGYGNTYCVKGSAHLTQGTQLTDNGSIYSSSFSDITDNLTELRWILDNMYLLDGADATQKQDMKENMISIIKEYASKKDANGKPWLAGSLRMDDITDDWINKAVNSLLNDLNTLYAVQQYAIWNYVKNGDSSYINALQNSDGTYNKLPGVTMNQTYYIGYYVVLREMAKNAKWNGYVSPNSSTFDISLESSSAKAVLQSDKKNMLIGPYTLKNNHVQLKKIPTATINSENASSVVAVNENGQAIDIKNYTGKFYFKVTYNKGFSKGVDYNINLNISARGYKTFGNILYPPANSYSKQPLVSVRREFYFKNLTNNLKYKEDITGKYSLEILKTGKDNDSNKPVAGVRFKVKPVGGQEKEYGPSNGDGMVSVIKNQEIKKPEQVSYIITEIETQDSIYAPLADPFQINITLDAVNEQYKPTKATFIDGKTTKTVTLKNGMMVSLVASIIGDTVRITIPNKEIEGVYSLELIKHNQNGNTIEGVTFNVQEGSNAPKSYGPTGKNGIASIGNKIIESAGIDEYTITEIKASNKYITLKDPLKVYVTKSKNSKTYKYEATKVSFEKDKEVKTKQVELKDGSKVNVNAVLSNSKISITIPNKEVEGNYSIELQKVNENSLPIAGVKFNVTENGAETKTYTSSETDGKIIIANNKQITNIEKDDLYQITEVSTKNNNYVMLKNPIRLYAKKVIKNYKYVISNIYFDQQQDNSVEKSDSNKIKREITAELQDGTKVTIKAELENNKIILTVPNKEINGDYDLEIQKVKLGSLVPLSGAYFTVKDGNNESKQYGPTLKDGMVSVVKNKKITDLAEPDEYTISEVKIKDDYITLKDSFKLYVSKEIKDYKYVVSKVSFEKGKETNEKQVELKDGTKVTVNAKLKNNRTIVITVPNKEISGNYSLQLEKVNSKNKNEKLSGVTFKVQDGKENAKEYGPTGEDGKITVFDSKKITATGIDKYTISEIKLNNEDFVEVKDNVRRNGFITLKDSFDIYVTKEIVDNKYQVTKVSFDENKEALTKKATLEDGSLVTISAEIVGNNVKITIPNKPDFTPLNFDMALRKSITKVTRNGKAVSIGENRAPVINEFSSKEYEETKTAGYYHTKVPVTVKPGDTILYTLRVYNEGEIEGYAKEITDYLPQNLEYIENSKINKENGWKVTVNSDGTTTVKTDILKDTLIKPANGEEGFASYAKLTDKKEPEFSKNVQIECKIKSNMQDKKLLVNVAEITNYGYLNDNKQYIQANKTNTDIDSVQNNVFTKKKEITNIDEYYDNVVVPQYTDKNKNYKGLEDDDDFENVYVEPDEINFKFVLNKVDEQGNPLIGADFTVTKQKEEETVTLLNNEEVKGTYEVLENDVRFNKTYTYKVLEVESAPEYVNVMKGKYITLKTYLNEERKLVLGNYEKNAEEDSLLNKYGFIINNTDGSIVKEKDTDLYEKIKVEVKNNVTPAQVVITIPNEKMTGGYSLELEKVDSSNNNIKLQGATFTVQKGTDKSKEYGPTAENGKVTVANKIEIEKPGVDEYTISEISLTDNSYITLKDSFRLYVTKQVKNDKYVASKISFNNTSEQKSSTEAETNVTLKDDTKVTVKAKLENNKIVITIPNKKITGNYSLEFEKVNSANVNEKLEGVLFKVQDGSNDAKEYGPTDKNGKVKIIENKEITNIGTDEYTISEIKLNQEDFVEINKDNVKRNGFIKIKDSFKIYITKSIVNNNYVASKVSFESGKEIKTKKVSLEDGSMVTLKAEIVGNTVKVTIPNKPDTTQLNFDLALRKYITKVTRSGKEISIGEDRTPVINEFSVEEYEKTHTAGYYHTKAPVTVKPGDTVLYTLRVYNEGDIEGYAKEITDYLPQGLEYVENSKINKENGWSAIVNKDGTTTVKTAKLIDTIIKPANGVEGFAEFAATTNKQNPEFSKYVQIECKVNKNLQDEKNLVNVAEISAYGYTNSEGEYVEASKEKVDIDSEQNNVFTKNEDTKNINGYYEKIVIPQIKDNNKNYKGIQDDDDFENLYVKPDELEIKFVLNKVDGEGKPLIGADFTVTREKDGISKTLLNNKPVNGTYETIETKVRYNKTYTYKVIEVESAPEYVNVMEGKYITLRTYMNENQELVIGSYEKLENEEQLIKKYGFVINNEDGTIVDESKTDLYGKIKVEIKNDVKPAQVVITIPNELKPKNFDLALRKFITSVTKHVGTENQKEIAIINRIPQFKIDEKGKYVYEHTKEPVVVANENIVTYTLRVYNEGNVDGYAKLIKDDIPQGLEFLPQDPINKVFRWVMLDKDGKETKDVKNAVYVVSDYLSKEQEKNLGENLIKAFDVQKYTSGEIKEPYYKEVKVAFKVNKKDKFDEIVINEAQISKHSDKDGKDVTDIDSTPDEWIDGEDDQDIEKIKVQYFDLSLRKWVTKAITIENGVQTVSETGHKAEDDPEQIVKVDLKDSKINDVTVKFEYKIRVKNEGQIAGFAKEISDYIPQGLKFVKEDNPDWKEVDGKVVTEKLKDTLLKPGETAEVTILLTWINDSKNMGLKVNTAEISKDYNEEGTPDIDSVPDNKVPGEDDIDDAPVMLTVKTGQGATYIALAGAVIVILASGTVLIRKFVLK